MNKVLTKSCKVVEISFACANFLSGNKILPIKFFKYPGPICNLD